MASHTSSPGADEQRTSVVANSFVALRGLGFVMLLLIVVSIAYASWIAILNWGQITV